MKISILAESLSLRGFAVQSLLRLMLTTSLLSGVAIHAQEKAIEPMRVSGWVVIPVEEYRVLRAKAYPVEHDREPPPLDATLTRVDYDLHVAGGLDRKSVV